MGATIKIKENTKVQNKDNVNNNNDNLTCLLTTCSDKQTGYEYESTVSLSDLRQHDVDIMNILYDSEDENTVTTLSFNGLKNTLKIHQEILSRSLKRLQELSFIERTRLGYKATEEGKLIFSKIKNTCSTSILSETIF